MKLMEANATKEDIHKLLDILLATDDSDVQVKVFSVLAISLVSRDDFKVDIVTCNAIYTKIRGILTQKLPSKIAITLNFISAMLYIDEEEGPTRKRTLVLHSQNMLRNSGCLLAMCYLFTSPMMHQDTWSALCRCIAESCHLSHDNQTFCSALVAECIKKGIQGDLEVLLTLKSLLNNNPLNVQLFLECNGLRIFNRTLLHYDDCLQLLDVLVQNVPMDGLKLLYDEVCEHLQYFKSLHRADTRVGQWATVILHHFSSKGIKDTDKSCVTEQKMQENNDPCSETAFKEPQCDDTANLLQNVMREIYQYNIQGAMKKPVTGNDNRRFFLQNSVGLQSKITNNTPKSISKVFHKESQSDLNYAFLLKQPSQDSRVNINSLQKSQKCESVSIKQTTNTINKRDFSDRTLNYYSYFNNTQNSTKKYHHNNNNTIDFKPVFVSTPKCRQEQTTSRNITKSSRISRYSLRTFKKHNSKNKESKINKKSLVETESSQVDSIRHRSISTRLFDVINESCTTLVKTVKNIFKPKKTTDKIKEKERASTSKIARPNDSCSYSFTEYMRKRDAELTNLTKNSSAISAFRGTDTCKTCNDTLQLKRKIVSDDYLRQTVKKLKMGINIYGCDFKKISRAMWPRETYMTPEVLYNLYRKVVLK